MTRDAPAPSAFVPPLLAGVALRLFGLTRQPLWIDEILTLRAASVGESFRLADVLQNPQGPLPHLWLRFWILLGGDGDLSLRLWAAFGGILALVLAAVAFRAVWPRAAVAGTWLLALSPFHVWYSQEVRNYPYLLAASALALVTLFRALDAPGVRRWAFHGVALGAALLCNLSAVFLVAAFGIGVLIARPRSVPGWLAAAVLAGLLALPWIRVELAGHVEWSGIMGGDPGGPLIRGGETFRPAALPYTWFSFLGGYGIGPPLRLVHGGLTASDWAPLLPGLAAAAAGAFLLVTAAWERRDTAAVRILLVAAVVPVLLAAAVALAGLKAFNPRYVAAAQPLVVLLLAIGWSELRNRRRILATVGLGLLLAVSVWGWSRQTFDRAYGKEDFRSAARFLAERTGADDLVLLQGVNGPLQRYYPGPAGVETFFPVYFAQDDAGAAKLEALLAGRDRVWWVGSRLWYEDPDRRLLRLLVERGEFVDSWRGSGVEVRGYRLDDAEDP